MASPILGYGQRRMSAMEKKILSISVALLLVIFAFALLTNGLSLEARNVSNLLRQSAINGMLAVGMTWVILLGGVDLSVGSMTALAGIVVALLQSKLGWGESQAGLVISISVVLAIGALLGLFNGFWVACLGIHSFIITFGMMVIARGLAMILSGGQSISPVSPELNFLGAGYLSPILSTVVIFGIPFLWILSLVWDARLAKREGLDFSNKRLVVKVGLIVAVATFLFVVLNNYEGLPVPVLISLAVVMGGDWILRHTRFGRYIYAVGGNSEAARLAGVATKKVVLIVFVVMGALSALAGIILTARLNGATPTAGQLFELDAVAAVVIGGTSLKGGKGSVLGSILGALIIETLNNGMSLMNVSPFYQMPLKGGIVILAVAMDSLIERKRA